MTSLRRDAAGRLMIGSMGRLIGTAERGLSRRWAERRIARLFPELGPVRFEAAWDGEIAMTPDHLPRIYRLAEGLYTPDRLQRARHHDRHDLRCRGSQAC